MATFLTTTRPGYYSVAIRAKPGARTSAFAAPVRPTDDAVEVRIAAPPVEGQANAELVSFMQSTLDVYLREWQMVTQDASGGADAAAAYFAGTAYEELLAMKSTATAADADEAPEKGGGGKKGGKRSKKRSTSGGRAGQANDNKNKGKSKNTSGKDGEDAGGALLPRRVSVSLARGSTSRTKVLDVEFPGSDVELVCLLQLASKED